MPSSRFQAAAGGSNAPSRRKAPVCHMDTHKKHLVALRDLPPQGKDFLVCDLAVWSEPIKEFHMDCRLEGIPEMELNILPSTEGWLLRGAVRASVVVPCSRCARDTPLAIAEAFEDYIQMPDEEGALPEDALSEGDDHLLFDHGAVLLDLAAVAWEQFALALPPTPLCDPACRGLCPTCGQDLNAGPCGCVHDEGDPRLAKLRGLKLKKS